MGNLSSSASADNIRRSTTINFAEVHILQIVLMGKVRRYQLSGRVFWAYCSVNEVGEKRNNWSDQCGFMDLGDSSQSSIVDDEFLFVCFGKNGSISKNFVNDA